MTRKFALILGAVFMAVVSAEAVTAWTGPSASPPNSNVSAPINVGTTDQVKNANIGINGLAVFGNTLLQGNAYLNWGATAGSSGYGVRDNAGTLEFKNSGGSWASIQSIFTGLLPTSQWTTSGANIYNANAGNVGINASNPGEKLEVTGNAYFSGTNAYIRFPHAYGDANDGKIGGNMFASGLNLVGINNDNTSRKIQVWGGITQNENGLGNTFIGNTNFPASGVWTSTGYVGVGISPTHRLHVAGPAVSGVNAIYGLAGVNDSVTYGVVGAAATYYGALGRGDGFSFVGLGKLYNNGSAEATSFLYISDRNLKQDIRTLDVGLVELMKLRPVAFTWKSGTPLSGERDLGLIAQDVQKVFPGIVHDNGKGQLSIDYVRLTPILIKALQEQEAKIESQQKKIDMLEEEVAAIKNRL